MTCTSLVDCVNVSPYSCTVAGPLNVTFNRPIGVAEHVLGAAGESVVGPVYPTALLPHAIIAAKRDMNATTDHEPSVGHLIMGSLQNYDLRASDAWGANVES